NIIDVQAEKQFSALTYLLDDKTAYIAYRGTDSSFVGWKEDFNMTFISPVPSQEEGVAYLNTLGEMISGDLLLGGHSKGGNIAIYSAINCNSSVQNKITQVFCHDAPGFRKEVLSSGNYLNMQDRIYNTIPQSSVIGMLLQHFGNYSVVKSNRIGIMQHDPYSWLIDGDDFQYVQRVNSSAIFKNKTLDDWLSALDDKKRELFIDTLYQVVKASEAETYFDLTEDWRKRSIAVLDAIKDIDEEIKRFVRQTIGDLFVYALKNLRDIHDRR
ncbi:MAG TPA: Mbeg1-like protein, partial [Desulfitobacteriaceae bacterium]|nr:Mbeg1-like protein [Desulfitobacteriaceae bacterium]